jgi:hypothetical protein
MPDRLCRIASALREVPQLGLCQMVAFIADAPADRGVSSMPLPSAENFAKSTSTVAIANYSQ